MTTALPKSRQLPDGYQQLLRRDRSHSTLRILLLSSLLRLSVCENFDEDAPARQLQCQNLSCEEDESMLMQFHMPGVISTRGGHDRRLNQARITIIANSTNATSATSNTNVTKATTSTNGDGDDDDDESNAW
mmetsp:Transcript_78956/g.140056  ORF Transcript_78956/g.140056 Transcript_78956/m.140056 type:complete len:132 (+) Transcript_78956:81-476(+)